MPLVSVCIPTYNYGRFLGRAIESALAQTHADIEVVVLDDASTDDTREVVARYDGDPRLRSERHDQNLGLFGNFNRCLEVARGEYVKVLCADDWLHERSLEDALALLEASPGAGMATSPAWHADADGRVIGMVRAPFGSATRVVPGRDAIRVHADWGNMGGMPSQVLIRRSALAEAGRFDPEFAPASDMHLWLKLLAAGDLGWVAEPRCTLRLHEEHGHSYAYEPQESGFSLWEDLARRYPGVVDQRLLRRALRREGRHHLLYVVHRLLRRDRPGARRLIRTMRAHAPAGQVAAGFVARLPAEALRQAGRLAAQRTGRLVVYGPAPRPGPRRETVDG